jgi:D-apionate oxidoisomerase
MTTITIMGAGGKMGYRISSNLRGSGYDIRHVEISEPGRKRLAELGVTAMDPDAGLDGTDVVILAIPDNLIRRVSESISPKLGAGTMLIALDAAAPFAGHLPKRDDLVYFVAHPCHPPIFNDETDPEAKRDYFGGSKAKQHIVCSLMQGPDSAYALGEDIARKMYAPVMRSHRVSVPHMAILEPVLSETVGATCLTIIREALDEAVRRGVPEQAAKDFIEGHLTVEIAILFGHLPGAQFSDGAKNAIERAKTSMFKPDWKRIFEPEAVEESIRQITG